MSRRPAVGIDIVDLREPRVAERGPSRRFVERVFTSRERRWLAARDASPAAVWVLWAAKEAAYKVVSALEGEAPVFEHRAFEVAEASADPGAAPASVIYRGRRYPVRLEVDATTVVALSWEPEGPAVPPDGATWGSGRLDPLREGLGLGDLSMEAILAERFRPDEARAVHSIPSALVRLALRREVAGRLEHPERELAVVCSEGPRGRVPPRLEGAPEPVGVSMSHHGDWVAWAVRTGRAAGSEAGS